MENSVSRWSFLFSSSSLATDENSNREKSRKRSNCVQVAYHEINTSQKHQSEISHEIQSFLELLKCHSKWHDLSDAERTSLRSARSSEWATVPQIRFEVLNVFWSSGAECQALRKLQIGWEDLEEEEGAGRSADIRTGWKSRTQRVRGSPWILFHVFAISPRLLADILILPRSEWTHWQISINFSQ